MDDYLRSLISCSANLMQIFRADTFSRLAWAELDRLAVIRDDDDSGEHTPS